VTDPEPEVVPVKVTEQLVTPEVVDKMQEVADKLPPVLPAVNVKVTVPVGALVTVVVSVTAAVKETVQLLPPNGMLQLAGPTEVDVLSLPVAVTVIVAAELVLVLWVASPP
jgi:hypothetical protein